MFANPILKLKIEHRMIAKCILALWVDPCSCIVPEVSTVHETYIAELVKALKAELERKFLAVLMCVFRYL